MDAKRVGVGRVVIGLTNEETLVLSDLLHRWERDGTQSGLAFEDQAEQRVIWDLTALLEPVTDGAFSADYLSSVTRARDALRDSTE
jgi:hypothetical protein